MGGQCFIGLMTGTSADGLDAALVEFFTQPPGYEIRATLAFPHPPSLKTLAIAFNEQGDQMRWSQYAQLDAELAQHMAMGVHKLLEYSGYSRRAISAIGMHGQTVFHQPELPHRKTVQLGNAAQLAANTGIAVISDFRAADMAHGGQGAPLGPVFQRYLLSGRVNYPFAVVNLGGIANVSLFLNDALEHDIGFDTGPANALMDNWIFHTQGRAYDADGDFAQQGTVNPELLHHLLADPYFHLPFPKSTGRDYFSLNWLMRKRDELAYRLGSHSSPTTDADVQATLLELTAQSLANALMPWASELTTILCTGGGTNNGVLIKRLNALLQNKVHSLATVGLPPDYLEAVGFAWLAKMHLDRQPLPFKQITGATRNVVAGAHYPIN